MAGMLGKTHTKATREKISKNLISSGVVSNENNPAWKGDKVGYRGLHLWVQRHKGKPERCEHCATTNAKRFVWANVSRQYKRDLDDWIRLCSSCHNIYDDIGHKAWVTKNLNKGRI